MSILTRRTVHHSLSTLLDGDTGFSDEKRNVSTALTTYLYCSTFNQQKKTLRSLSHDVLMITWISREFIKEKNTRKVLFNKAIHHLILMLLSTGEFYWIFIIFFRISPAYIVFHSSGYFRFSCSNFLFMGFLRQIEHRTLDHLFISFLE